MSKITRIETALLQNTDTPGVTPAQLARKARVNKETVYKRVSDLRHVYGMTIYSNYREVNGQRKMFYRLAA